VGRIYFGVIGQWFFLAQGPRFQMSGWGFRFRDLVCKVSALGFVIQDFRA
jgi:hypothetical protein